MLTKTGPVYSVEEVVGVLPCGRVIDLECPRCVSEMVTDCALEYVPAAGLNVGVAACGDPKSQSEDSTTLASQPIACDITHAGRATFDCRRISDVSVQRRGRPQHDCVSSRIVTDSARDQIILEDPLS